MVDVTLMIRYRIQAFGCQNTARTSHKLREFASTKDKVHKTVLKFVLYLTPVNCLLQTTLLVQVEKLGSIVRVSGSSDINF